MSKHLLCTWCKGVLNSKDKIYSTSCGHVFHFGCMRKCQNQSTSCPQCSYVSPATHELFLFFEKCQDEDIAKNWNGKLKIIELQKEVEDNKTVVSHLQEKYSASQDLVRKLEEKNRISNNGITQRTSIISDLEDRIKVLEELNQFLTIDSESKSKSLTLKSREITELKDSLAKGGTESNVRKQAEKQKKDKTELQKCINLFTLDTAIKGTAKNYSNGKTRAPNSSENINKKASYQKEPEKHILAQEVTEDYSVTSISEMINPQDDSILFTDRSILINNFPKEDLHYPLKKLILTFVVCKEGYISEEEIAEVYIKDGNGKNQFQLPKEVTLYVQFKNRYIKNKFLLNCAGIQQASPSLEFIEIDKYNNGIKATAKNCSNGTTKVPNYSENNNTTVSYQNEPEKHILAQKVSKDYSVNSISEMFIQQGNSNSFTGTSILIKNYPKNELHYPLNELILTFVASKQGYISKDDITEVYVKDGYGKDHSQLPKEVTLYVQFKNPYLKHQFLLNRAAMQQASPSLEIIEMDKYHDGIKATAENCSNDRTKAANYSENSNSTVSYQIEPEKHILPQEVAEDYSVTSIPEMCNPQYNLNLSTENSIFIKNIPKQDLIHPLEKLILTFVVSKQGYISKDDITEVYVKDSIGKSYSQLPAKVTLFVGFRNRDLKNKFLLNLAHIHQATPPLEIIEIDKYNDGIKTTAKSNSDVRNTIPDKYNDAIEATAKSYSDVRNTIPDKYNDGIKATAKSYSDVRNTIPDKYNDGMKATAKSYSDGRTTIPNSRDNYNTKVAYNVSSLKHQNVPEQKLITKNVREDNSVTCISEYSKDSGSLIAADSKDNSLYIKNFPKNKLIYPLKKLIQEYISEDDITEIYVKDAYGKSYIELPMEVTLFVQFRNRYIKNKFILNRALILQASPSLEFIEIDKYNDSIKATVKNYSNGKTETPNSSENINTKVSYQNEPEKCVLQQEVTEENSVTPILEDNSNSTTDNNCILIKNFPKTDLISPLKHVILRLVTTKQGDVSEEDITEVYVKGGKGKRNYQLPENVTLFVKFKNRDLKNKFLLNQVAIQQASPSLEFSEIDNCNDGINRSTKSNSDYKTMKPNAKDNINTKVPCTASTVKDPSVNFIPECSMDSGSLTGADSKDLLKYAKQKLNGKGFSYFFCHKDEVMALKNRSDAEGIRIRSKSHVNKLLKSQKKN